MKISEDVNLQTDMASALVEAYEPRGVAIVRDMLEKNFDDLQASKIAIALHGLYTFYVGAFTIKDEYNYLNQLTNKALQKTEITDKEKVALYNVLASLEYSMKNDLQALEYQKKPLSLCLMSLPVSIMLPLFIKY